MARRANSWNLYWVSSDGIEDCFVVAKNSRSACRVELKMNGFEPQEVLATKIAAVPEKVRAAYEKRKKHAWPWYVYGKPFFRGLGAEFIRTSWGRDELVIFLAFFDIQSRAVKQIFRAAFHASLEYGVHFWGRPKKVPENYLPKKYKDEVALFFELFQIRKEAR